MQYNCMGMGQLKNKKSLIDFNYECHDVNGC